MDRQKYIQGIERLVRPLAVSGVVFFSNFSRRLPAVIQRRMIRKSQQQFPLMGFLVDPYSYYLFYDILDLPRAQELVGEGYTVTKVRVCADDEEERCYSIFGCFNARTTAFWGTRVEMYIPAIHDASGMLTWVIVDYATSANSMDPKTGLTAPNAPQAVCTTDFSGNIILDVEKADGTCALRSVASTDGGERKALDQRLWLEGNLSIDYGTILRDGQPVPFSLRFDPGEVEYAMEIPVDDVVVTENAWHQGLCGPAPARAFYFPYAQHFVSSSYPDGVTLRDREALRVENDRLGDMSDISVFSVESIVRRGFWTAVIVQLLNLLLIGYLLYHFIVAH